jgi:polyhydroxybutyrate depolymerase
MPRPSPISLAVTLAGLVAFSCVGAGCGTTHASNSGGAPVPYGAPFKPAVAAAGEVLRGSLRTPDGRVRTYRVYVPNSLPAQRRVPLLVALHGGLGSGKQFEQISGFDGLAQANRFLVVYPDGTRVRGLKNSCVWNAGGCCGAAEQARGNLNDVRFISLLIDKLEREYRVDRKRVFVNGHSNGAMLGLRLACQLSDTVDAVAVQSGTLFIDSCRPRHGVAVLEIHGTADQNVPINGGKGPKDVSGKVYPPPEQGLETIAAADRCSRGSLTSSDPKNHALTYEVWRPCSGGTVVEWINVAGASHAWMGHRPSSVFARIVSRRLSGKPYMGFDSSAVVWSFLSAQPRR